MIQATFIRHEGNLESVELTGHAAVVNMALISYAQLSQPYRLI